MAMEEKKGEEVVRTWIYMLSSIFYFMLFKTRNEKDINIIPATKYFYFVWLKMSNDYKIRTISRDERTTVAG